MREHVRALCASAILAFEPSDPVVEFGSFQVPEQRGLGDLRPLFPGARYIGCDARPGAGVDCIDDVAASRFDSAFAGTVVCLDTLEHVFSIAQAVQEMHRLLRPGGLLVAATTMHFPIHDYPEDYWRLTPRCLDRLVSPFDFSIVGSQGVETFPHTVFAVAVKAPAPFDVTDRCTRFIGVYRQRLAEARKRLPRRVKLRRFFRSCYRSKGERRALASEYTVRFSVRHNAAGQHV
jgi:SAM-dependent methyltransferase